MWEAFTWRGKPIRDIRKWASDRSEKMVHYRYTVRTVYGPEVSEGYMPESFYDRLMFKGNEEYVELGRA